MEREKPLLLAIDDSPINLRLISMVLGKEGFEILCTENSLEAVHLATETQPDLILLDMMLPGTSGLEICRLLKSQSETKEIPVIMVTAKTLGTDVMDALEAGAYDYIKKPLDEPEVVARVRSALRYKIAQDKLREMAMRDSLTGLYNHALIMEFLDKELYQQRRKNSPLCFVMADIDHFKSINDNYGHLTGDLVLREISQRLASSLRHGDLIGRYGGEEFAIIFRGVDGSMGPVLSERIRQMIADNPVITPAGDLKITMSFGLACSTSHSDATYLQIVAQADEALYAAKAQGRNRVLSYQNPITRIIV